MEAAPSFLPPGLMQGVQALYLQMEGLFTGRTPCLFSLLSSFFKASRASKTKGGLLIRMLCTWYAAVFMMVFASFFG